MLNPNIPYAFNQFELNFVALATFLQTRLQFIVPNLPVFMQNNGDFSYFTRKKWVHCKNEEVIQKVPRFIFRVDDIQINQQEDTCQYNKIYYVFDKKDGQGPKNYCCAARRKAYNVMITTNFVSSNFISMLNHIEVFATLAARENVFTYNFLGHTISSAFTVMGMNNEIPNIDMGQGGTRNCTAINQLELQVHLLVPRIESIALVDDSGFEQVMFEIISKGDEQTIVGVKDSDEDDTIKPTIDEENSLILTEEDTEDSEDPTVCLTDPDIMSPKTYWPAIDAGSVIPTDQKKSQDELEPKYNLEDRKDLYGEKGYDSTKKQTEIPAGSVIPVEMKQNKNIISTDNE